MEIKKVAAMMTAVTAGMLVFGASPASAHDKKYWATSQDGTTRGYVVTQFNHTHFEVCDTRADGVGVYGRMKLRNGTILDIVDPNGSSGGCGTADTTSGNAIVEVEAVWRGGATSGWQPA